MADSLSDQRVIEVLSAARWEAECMACSLDTYGGEDIHKLVVEHVAETGHEVRVARKQWGRIVARAFDETEARDA